MIRKNANTEFISRKMRLAISLLIFSFTVSCTQTIDNNIKSQFYSVPEGSTLTLNKPVEIIQNTARTYFQNGLITKENDLNIYYPHCSITVNNLLEHNRTLKPTSFTIYKVEDQEEHAQRFIMYASIKSLSHSDGPSIIGQASYYYLKSADEPDVRTLECVQWGDPFYVKYVSISDIQSALGEFFTLELARSSIK